MIDKAKMRLAAAIIGSCCAFIGVAGLAVSMTLYASATMGMPMAALVTGGGFFLVGGCSMWFFLLPEKSIEEEQEQFNEAAAASLADIPLETITHLIEKRPLAAVLLFASFGYSVGRNPTNMAANIQRLIYSLM